MNPGVGLLLARHSGSSLVIDADLQVRPEVYVPGGTHALVVCETDEELSQVIAANFAYAIGASYLVMPELPANERRRLLELLYVVGSQEQQARFGEITAAIGELLPAEVFQVRYSEVVFVTSGVPWGIALPGCPTSHLYSYPDLGRIVAEGIWAANDPNVTARNALLISPGDVAASDIEVIRTSLVRNRTLIRALEGPQANVHQVDLTVRSIPFDVIAIATHAGDWHGRRLTYEFLDDEGRTRVLVVDEAVGVGYSPKLDMYPVQTYYAFRSLDGVDWNDDEGKQRLPVGSAMNVWSAFVHEDRRRNLVSEVPIDRVRGAMGLKMADHVWLLGGHDLAPPALPLVINNACSSFHSLSEHFMFGGARAYVGALVPIADAEALEITRRLFGQELGMPLARGLWNAQRAVYGDQPRRPYVMVGLPFGRIARNNVDSVAYVKGELQKGIAAYQSKATHHPDEGVRRNSDILKDHLVVECELLDRRFPPR